MLCPSLLGSFEENNMKTWSFGPLLRAAYHKDSVYTFFFSYIYIEYLNGVTLFDSDK